jgi:hypothetical protein
MWSHTGTRELAQLAPLAATAGKPMPGKRESPQQYRPDTGVVGPGNRPLPALMAGPAVVWGEGGKERGTRGVRGGVICCQTVENNSAQLWLCYLQLCVSAKPALTSQQHVSHTP